MATTGDSNRKAPSGRENQHPAPDGGWAANVVAADQQRLPAQDRAIRAKKLELVIALAEQAIARGEPDFGRGPITSWIEVLEQGPESQDPNVMAVIAFLNEAVGELARAGYWYKRAADGGVDDALPGMARVLNNREVMDWLLEAYPKGNVLAAAFLKEIAHDMGL